MTMDRRQEPDAPIGNLSPQMQALVLAMPLYRRQRAYVAVADDQKPIRQAYAFIYVVAAQRLGLGKKCLVRSPKGHDRIALVPTGEGAWYARTLLRKRQRLAPL